jgi:corrinoid protein of di/trimethylamine methyltransferase
MSKKKILERLQDSLAKSVKTSAFLSTLQETINADVDSLEIIDALTDGLQKLGERFANEDLFLPELVLAGESMTQAMEILNPLLHKEGKQRKIMGKLLIGSAAGDIHSIGKNIVSNLFQANGFEVIDLGINIPNRVFVEKTIELKPDILGISALLTTTMIRQKEVIEELKIEGIRDQVKVMVGGCVVTEEWAEEIGADGFGVNATDAVEKAMKML